MEYQIFLIRSDTRILQYLLHNNRPTIFWSLRHIMRIMQMKFPVPTRQCPKWPTYFPAHSLKVLLQAFHPKHAVHCNVSVQADPIHLRTPAVNSRTDFRSPAPWFIMERVGERGSHPF